MGGNILGNTDSVRAMNRDRIEGFVARHYHPNEMVFSVVGATRGPRSSGCVRSTSDGFRWIFILNRAPFEGWAVRCPLEKDIHQVHHVMGMLTHGSNHPDRLGLALIANHLGGSTMNNRLSLNVRERHGWRTISNVPTRPHSDVGVFQRVFERTSASTSAPKPSFARSSPPSEDQARCTPAP